MEAWSLKTVGEVAKVGAGNSAPQDKRLFENGIYPFVRTSDIGKIRIGTIRSSADNLNDIGIKKLKLFPIGTILFPKSGASTFLNHRVALEIPAYVSSHLATIIPNETCVHPRFLLHYLTTIRAQNLIQDHKYPSLKRSDIEGISVPLPPLPEQQRIVAILDEAFEGIGAVVTSAKKNLANARKLFESYLNNVFTQNGEGWMKKQLGKVCEVKDGTHDSPKYVENGIPLVTQKNIRISGLTLENTKTISLEDHEKFYKRSNVAAGDIIISMIGVNRGMACIVDDERVFSIKNVGLIKSSDVFDAKFLLHYLKSRKAEAYVVTASRGGAQPFIGLNKLREFPVPIIPVNQQIIISRELDELLSETQHLEAIYQRKLDALAELKQSILQKAFSGELTAQEVAA